MKKAVKVICGILLAIVVLIGIVYIFETYLIFQVGEDGRMFDGFGREMFRDTSLFGRLTQSDYTFGFKDNLINFAIISVLIVVGALLGSVVFDKE